MNWYAITQYILGTRPAYEGLEIDPCICSQWKEYSVKRRFRGATYDITILNPNGVCKGVREIELDGKKIVGHLIPHSPGDHKVVVVLG